MLDVKTLHIFDTEYSADSVEWTDEGVFVVGTYQLEEKDEDLSNTKRKGRIYLFKFDPKDSSLDRLQQFETEAILDMKWYEKDLLVTSTSLGKIQFYNFREDGLSKTAEVILNHEDSENLALSIDVNEQTKRILASDSQGKISLIDAQKREIISCWKAHEFVIYLLKGQNF